MLPDVMFGCLHQALGGGVPAEGTSCLWNLFALGGPGSTGDDPAETVHAKPFSVMSFHAGGTGARPGADGLSATAFPSGVRTCRSRSTRRCRRSSSGARSTARIPAAPASSAAGWARSWRSARSTRRRSRISAYYDRIDHPARGREGGLNGTAGSLTLSSGKVLRGKGQQTVPSKDRVIIAMPGGGGLGNPRKRPAAVVAEDVRQGFISSEAARRDYGVAVNDDGTVDEAETAKLRAASSAAPSSEASGQERRTTTGRCASVPACRPGWKA